MIRHYLTGQFIRFLLVGGISAMLHWLARYVISRWLPFVWAVGCAYCIGMAIAFVLNRIFVFPRSLKSRSAQGRDFVLVNLAFLPVVWAISVALKIWFEASGMQRYAEELAHGVAIPVPMLATFLIYKFFAFKERSA